MADPQNPQQKADENVQNTGTNAGDLLGDISLSFPEATEAPKTEPAKQEISDLSDVLVEKSLDAAQQKAEDKSMPEAETEIEPSISVPTETPAAALNETPEISAELTNFNTEATETIEVTQASADPTKIDLGDIHIPPTEEGAKEETTAPATPAATETPETPSWLFKNEEEIKIPDSIPTAHEEESDAMSIHEINEHNDLVNITLPTEIPAAPVTPEPVINTEQLPVAEENTDSVVGTLINNESENVVNAPAEPTIESAPIEPAPSEPTPVEVAPEAPIESSIEWMTMDLDALTNDIGGQAGAAMSAASAPAETSVILPTTTMIHPPKSTKKKVFAMVVLFILLLVLGGFVFKTMMPEETERLIASIAWTSSPTVVNNETAETGTEVGTLVDTGADTMSGAEMTGEAVIATSETGNTISDTGTQNTQTLSLDEAKNILSTINEESRKNLAAALKIKQKNASDILYMVFKDSTNLLEALANISDISTIPDIDSQIANMQTDLHQATIMLNVANSPDNTQS